MKMKETDVVTRFAKLTYGTLVVWAGEENAERGKAEVGHVRRLGRMPDGGILASVAGIRDHVACMWYDKAGELHSECTCAEATNCHHAVSILLRCAEMLKAGEGLPLIDPEDDRIKALDATEDEVVEPTKRGRHKRGDIEGYISTFTKEDLVELVLTLLNRHSADKQEILEKMDLNGHDDKALIQRITNDIQKLQKTVERREAAGTKGSAPDVTKFASLFANLFERGYYEDVMDLGLWLKNVGARLIQAGKKSDFGMLEKALDRCCRIIENARAKSTKSEVDLLFWDVLFFEGYHVLYKSGPKDSSISILKTASQETWSSICPKLEDLITQQTRADYPLKRELLYKAMKRAGRREEVLEIKLKSSVSAEDYIELIDELLKEKKVETAEQWYWKAIRPDSPLEDLGKKKIEKKLETIFVSLGRYVSAASIVAKWFFGDPELDTYRKLQKHCKKAGIWEGVREKCLDYLITQKLPEGPGWPLEPISLQVSSSVFHDFPNYPLRMEIALWEEDTSDIFQLYQTMKKSDQTTYFAWNREKFLVALERDYPLETLHEYLQYVGGLINSSCSMHKWTIENILRSMYPLCQKTQHMDIWDSVTSHIAQKTDNAPYAMKIIQQIESSKKSKKKGDSVSLGRAGLIIPF